MKTCRLTIALYSLLFALAATAQTPPSGASLNTNPVYQKSCAKCHGKTAEGRHFGGPSLISEKAQTDSAGDLHNVISSGKGRMPKYEGKLTQQEIDTLVQQIKAVNKK